MEPQPAPVPDLRRRAPRTMLWSALVAFAAGLAVMAAAVHFYTAWRPLQSAATPPDIATGTQPTAAPAGTAASIAPDFARVDRREIDLDVRLASLEERLRRVDADADAASGNAGRAESLMVAFAARRALDRGLGLGYLEDALQARFGAGQPRAVAAVLQAARDPVTIADLRGGLDGIAPDLVSGGMRLGWWASFKRELSGLVVVHRQDTPSPRPADRLSRAHQLLDAGQVSPALGEVVQMPGAASADRWIAAARRYVVSRRALDILEATALQTPEPPAPPGPVVIREATAPVDDEPALNASSPTP